MPETRHRQTSRHMTSEDFDLESEFSLPHIPVLSYPSQLRQDDTDDHDDDGMTSNLAGDRLNVALLTFLYILQGIPLGLAGSIPLILQQRNVSYKDQAIFTFVYWPFSIKLLWAPIVDSLYSTRFGRRRTWLVPTQYLIGLFMLILSAYVDELFGDESKPPRVALITFIFFMLNFLAATQDIAVDGWALTMLSKRNVGYASTCNSVGQTAGYFLGNVVFIALESADFCNKYLRSVPAKEGVVTLSGFMFFWGIVFFVTTTIVMLLKSEDSSSNNNDHNDPDVGIIGTYKMLKDIILLPAVLTYVFNTLTSKIGFSAADAITGLKLIEAGVPKERLTLLVVPMVPLQILLPLIISKYTAGRKPMDIYMKAFVPRLLVGIEFAIVVYLTPYMRDPVTGEFPLYYYAILLASYALHQVALYSMFVAVMAFHAKISDPAVGGTYMTLLNTVTNLGGIWPATMALWFVDSLTSKSCDGGKLNGQECSNSERKQFCLNAGGVCSTDIDGYYVEVIVCLAIGLLWFLWRKRSINRLQTLPESSWKCIRQ
ncbi:SLC33A1 (predicted) [Pycnogonum litorale]